MGYPTGTCEGCKWWSEMLANSVGCGPILALCLNEDSNHSERMVHHGCAKYAAGSAVDDPIPEPERS